MAGTWGADRRLSEARESGFPDSVSGWGGGLSVSPVFWQVDKGHGRAAVCPVFRFGMFRKLTGRNVNVCNQSRKLIFS